MELASLPYTIFLEIFIYLSPHEAVAARRVSRSLRAALIQNPLSISLLQLHFPRAREARDFRRFFQTEFRGGDGEPIALLRQYEEINWAAVFATVARRYHYLGTATPRTTITVPVSHDSRWLRPQLPWNRCLDLIRETAFCRPDPVWTCDVPAGVVVYPVDGRQYMLRDVHSGRTWALPFDTSHKYVQRVRLRHGILIFEWHEDKPCDYAYSSDESGSEKMLLMHYATAYDVKRRNENRGPGGEEDYFWQHCRNKTNEDDDIEEEDDDARKSKWDITFRATWKIHPTGLLFDTRYFSTHNASHYAVYIWQPNSTPVLSIPMPAASEPTEIFWIWDLGEPQQEEPLADEATVTKEVRQTVVHAARTADSSRREDKGPRCISRFEWHLLDHWDVRQGHRPTIQCLRLDDCTRDAKTGAATGHVFVVEEEHRWSAGRHARHRRLGQHHVKTTGIPLGDGPKPVGPRWVDECGQQEHQIGSATTGQLPFCWRGEQWWQRRRLHGEVEQNGLLQATTSSLSPIERSTWPGRCPCWRHDDFPYLTVSAVHDVGAGVWFSARHCDALSKNIAARLSIHGVARPTRNRRLDWPQKTTAISGSQWSRSSSGNDESSGSNAGGSIKLSDNIGNTRRRMSRLLSKRRHEDDDEDDYETAFEGKEEDGKDGFQESEHPGIQFADDTWARMLAADYICGEERWLMGQDIDGNITIMYF